MRLVCAHGRKQSRSTYFGCHELWSATERARRRSEPHIFLAETVVTNLDVAIQVEEDVVKLEITVNNTVLVEVFQRQANFGSIESVEDVSILCQERSRF